MLFYARPDSRGVMRAVRAARVPDGPLPATRGPETIEILRELDAFHPSATATAIASTAEPRAGSSPQRSGRACHILIHDVDLAHK